MGRSVRWTVLQGREKYSGAAARILFSGSRPEMHDIADRFFAGQYRAVFSMKLSRVFSRLLLQFNPFRCDLMVLQHRPGQHPCPGPGDIISPLWVRSGVRLPLQIDRESAKSDIRRFTRSGLEWRVTREPSMIADFTENMWIPMLKRRYPYKNVDSDRDAWKQADCELLLIIDPAEGPIGGVLVRYVDGRPSLWRIGVTDGDPAHWSKGVSGAAYYFTLKYLESLGHEFAGLGLCRAFLEDGVLRYKKKWNCEFQDFRKHAYAFRVLKCTRAARSFFCHNPLVLLQREGFAGAVFVDGQPEEEALHKMVPRFFFNGLGALHFYSADDWRLIHVEHF
ncbi:hypothetical protein CR163_002850 [Prosthecochloris sp. ZM_2]|uniref:hypothetical protein n=1 Tax=Prosthecochloris sp. ZM_2 TaxID=2045206 RepID=UPI000DF7E404|nr:hypothetical protein [Prosthecochloris sp. ZM_2]RNA64275.1 hypothetical protein CR163_002850 [Prosthecochloris sp. ZM_2]